MVKVVGGEGWECMRPGAVWVAVMVRVAVRPWAGRRVQPPPVTLAVPRAVPVPVVTVTVVPVVPVPVIGGQASRVVEPFSGARMTGVGSAGLTPLWTRKFSIAAMYTVSPAGFAATASGSQSQAAWAGRPRGIRRRR